MRFFGKVSSPITREQILLNGIDERLFGLEIGPSHRPVAAKREGFNVRVLDHLDALQAMAQVREGHITTSMSGCSRPNRSAASSVICVISV